MIAHATRKAAFKLAAALLVGAAIVTPASAAEITVMISGAITPAFTTLKGEFEKKTGHKVTTVSGGSMGDGPTTIPNRIRAGETDDVLMIARPSVEDLSKEGLVIPTSVQNVGISKVGFAVMKGMPVPDISTPDKLKAVLLKANSISYSTSASGQYIKAELFKKMGIEKEIATKKIALGGGSSVAKGEAEVGFQQVSELMALNDKLTVVGPIPDSLQLVTPWTAAIPIKSKNQDAAKQLIAFMLSAESQKVIGATGLAPVK